MVLHRHVGKRDQSSFLLQEQFFFFLPPRYRLGHLRPCDWHSNLRQPASSPALPCLAVPWDCHVPNTHVVQSHHTRSFVPAL